ncbi:MAG: flagellar export chaperone FlgN [Planctomycetaceae bacterium]
MSEALVAEVRKFLRNYESTQLELGELYRHKRTALVEANTPDLLRIAESESKLAIDLKDQLGRRRQILQQSAKAGLPGESIRSLVAAFDQKSRAELEPQIERAQATATHVRRESWIHFIIAQRSLHQYNDLMELIAHCGQKSPTYSRVRGQETTGGGAILDASA